MGGTSKFITNRPTVLSGIDNIKNVQIGIVASIDDPQGLGRIKVVIPGSATNGGDEGILLVDLPWSYPMVPKFFTSTPRVGEAVFVFIFSNQKTHSDRLYLGPIISQPDMLNNDQISTSALNPFSFAILNPKVDITRIPALKGVFPNIDDISVQGRYNTDVVLKSSEILIRAGKFVVSTPNDNNPYPFEFNTATQTYIQIKNDVPLNQPKENETQERGSVANIIANKINLLTHKDGTPRFNLTNQDNLLSDEELLSILATAHQLPFGDILIEYLKLLKAAFLNHVHNGSGRPPTDLVAGGAKQDVLEFKKNSEDLENRMLSKNVRIN
jgi:hypothetical protein